MLQEASVGPLSGWAPVLAPAMGRAVKPWQRKLRCPPAVQDPVGHPALDVLGDALRREGPLRRLRQSGAGTGACSELCVHPWAPPPPFFLEDSK